MSNRGHNENAVRLGILADDAKRGLERVTQGEADAIEGWLAYGAALNEGRALFPGDREFGRWLKENVLSQVAIAPDDQAAAVWASANRDQFEEARETGNARTVRGIHKQWKQIEADRDAEAKRQADEAARKEREAKAQAEAEAKRKEAAKRAAAEAEARAAAAAAKTEADRKQAEARAEAEREAKEAAEHEAEAAEAAVADDEDPPDEDPDTAKARREIARLTEDAMIDEILGLRANLAEAKAKVSAQRAEIEDLKAKVRELSSDDGGAVIAKLSKKLKHAENEKWRQTEETGRAMKQVHALKKRVAELESVGIRLNP